MGKGQSGFQEAFLGIKKNLREFDLLESKIREKMAELVEHVEFARCLDGIAVLRVAVPRTRRTAARGVLVGQRAVEALAQVGVEVQLLRGEGADGRAEAQHSYCCE